MKKHFTSLLLIAAFLSGCIEDSHRNYSPSPTSTSIESKRSEPPTNQSVSILKKSWEEARNKLQAIQKFSKHSPRFNIYCGYAMATAADVIDSWRIAEGNEADVRNAKMNLDIMKELFENSFYLAAFPDWESDDISTAQQVSMIVAAAPHFFFLDMLKRDISFQVDTNGSTLRNRNELKAKILSALKQDENPNSACYWLGFLAREAEKGNEPLDDYWNSCNTEGVDADGLVQLSSQ
jgi:hypothetical protein